MAEERFYIIGKVGGTDGFGVYNLQNNASCNNQIDKSVLDIFHNYDSKEIKELFSIKRTKNSNRVYYTYIRFDLMGDRNGCMLGFTYVYENGNNIIDDLLTLRKRLKDALSKLIDGNRIRIKSFNDSVLQECYKEISNFTNSVKAIPIRFANSNNAIVKDSYRDVDDETLQSYISNHYSVDISENIISSKQKLQQIESNYNSIKQKLQETESQLGILVKKYEDLKFKYSNNQPQKPTPQLICPKDKKQPFYKQHLFPIISIVLQLAIIALLFFNPNKQIPTNDISTYTLTEETIETNTENEVSQHDLDTYKEWIDKNKKDSSSHEISDFTKELCDRISQEEKCKIHKELYPDLYE